MSQSFQPHQAHRMLDLRVHFLKDECRPPERERERNITAILHLYQPLRLTRCLSPFGISVTMYTQTFCDEFGSSM